MDTKKQYDLIFDIGETCSCTQCLRDAELQEASFPFDWLFGSDFIGRCDILTSEFLNFINKADLSFAGYNNGDNKNLCDVYYNNYNKIAFNHDFPVGINIEESYPQIAQKYKRRIDRLINKIQTSQKILIVYLEIPTEKHVKVSDETIIAGYTKIIKKFGQENKKIELLYFENMTGQKHISETVLVDGLKKITFDYKNKNPEVPDHVVESKKILKVLRQYKLKKL